MFGVGYFFTDWIEEALEKSSYSIVLLAVALGGFLLDRYFKARLRAGLPSARPCP